MSFLQTIVDARKKPVFVFWRFSRSIFLFQEILLLYIGDDTTLSAAVVPILFCGWFLGATWAMYTGLVVSICFTLFKLLVAGSSELLEISVGIISIVLFTLIGVAIGRMEELNRLVKKELLARTLAEKALEEKTQQLSHSNQELEQFAYIASHDLQEPLRKITAFPADLSPNIRNSWANKGRIIFKEWTTQQSACKALLKGF